MSGRLRVDFSRRRNALVPLLHGDYFLGYPVGAVALLELLFFIYSLPTNVVNVHMRIPLPVTTSIHR